MRNMLLYLATKSAEQPGEGVKEFELATQALGKGDDYDPRTDSAVRVVALRLRSKLMEYYAQEGANDPVVISIPKGSYLLVSTYRQTEHPATVASDGVIFESTRAKRTTRRLFLGAGASGLAGAVAGFYAGHQSMRPDVPASVRTFWHHFIDNDAPIVVYSNARFVKKADSTSVLCLANPPLAEGPIISAYTGVGEVMAVHQIARQLSLLGREPRVKRAELFTWDDANSNDLIFVGGQQQNLPMSQLPKLEDFNLKPAPEDSLRTHVGVRNVKPASGELPFYRSSDDADNGVDYGVLALTRGANRGNRVLVLAGVRTFGTQAVASAVCTPALLDELLRRLSITSASSSMPFFEALIETQIRGGVPLTPTLRLVHKRIEYQ